MASTRLYIHSPPWANQGRPLSLQRPLVDAYFRFASSLFEVLGRINEIFRGKYGFVHYFWEYMVPFYQLMKYELEKIENGDFTTYPFLGQLRRCEIPQFTRYLKHLILNLNMRFFNVSFSLNKKSERLFELRTNADHAWRSFG